MIKRLADYHIHTERCGHARGEMKAFVEKAIAENLVEIGFADHAPAKEGFDPRHRMTINEFPDYVTEIEQLRSQFPGIMIRLGIEMDLYEGFETELVSLREAFPIDYVIGSVHFIGEDAIYYPDEAQFHLKDVTASVRNYFSRLQEGVNSEMIDVIGHFDLIRWAFPGATEIILEQGRETLKFMGRSNTILELNTSGLRKTHDEMYPGQALLAIAREYQIPVCLGSDAHKPDDVAADFSRALDVLIQAGYHSKVEMDHGLSVFRPLVHESIQE